MEAGTCRLLAWTATIACAAAVAIFALLRAETSTFTYSLSVAAPNSRVVTATPRLSNACLSECLQERLKASWLKHGDRAVFDKGDTAERVPSIDTTFLGLRPQLSKVYPAMEDSELDAGDVDSLRTLGEEELTAWYSSWKHSVDTHPCCKFWTEEDASGKPITLRQFGHVDFSVVDVFRALGNRSVVVFGGDSVSRVGRVATLCQLVASGATLGEATFPLEADKKAWSDVKARQKGNRAPSFCKILNLLDSPSRHSFTLPAEHRDSGTVHTIAWTGWDTGRSPHIHCYRPLPCVAHGTRA